MVQSVFLRLACCALLLSGCAQQQRYDCTAIPPPPPGMLYPVNGATNVPDSFTLVLTWAETPIELQTAGIAVEVQPTAMPSPLPTPNAGPAYNNAAYRTGNLRPATTYQVLAPSPTCEGQTAPQPIGSFTTS